jgi:hypothetical protein
MTLRSDGQVNKENARKEELGQRLDALGWGLFLIMLGGLWLVPEDWGVPEGTWLIGTGVILLGLILVRYINGLQISGFWLFLGALALGSGLASVLGLDLPVFPILLVIAGAGILLKPLFDRMRS